MRDVFIAAAVQVLPGEGFGFHELVEVLRSRAGVPAHRAQALYRLTAGETKEDEEIEGTPCFSWRDQPGLASFVLHSAARAIQLDEADLVVVVQAGEQGCVALALASPTAAGRYNLAPRARLALMASLPPSPDMLATFALALERARPMKADTPAQDAQEPEEVIDLPQVDEVNWLAAKTLPPDFAGSSFPNMQWVDPGLSGGDYYALLALLQKLEEDRAHWGLLLGQDSPAAVMATLIERV